MSGLLGLWNLDARPVDPPVLARLSAALQHRGPDGEGRWVKGPVALACHLLRVTPEAASEVQPVVGASGSVLVFDGRLDNREELHAAVGSVPRGAPDSTLVLAAYDAFGDRFPERLNGEFALALFDPRRQRLLLVRDAVGVRPLYYGRVGSAFVAASEIKGILAHPRARARPNDDMLADLLMKRLQLRPDRGETCFLDVFSVPPGHAVAVTPERIDTRQYFDFDPSSRSVPGGFDAYAEEFRDLFARAVRRRLRSACPVVVSVSGGLDSSSIFCVAAELAKADPGLAPPIGTSYVAPPGSPSDEGVFLTAIEGHTGAGIRRLPVAPATFLQGCREEVSRVEIPMLDSQGNASRAFLEASCRLGARVILTGHWGDQVLFDTTYLADLAGRLDWVPIWTHMNEYGKWFTDTAPAEFRRMFLADLVRRYLPTTLPVLQAIKSRVSTAGRMRQWYSRTFRDRGTAEPSDPRWKGSLGKTHALSLYRQVRSRFFGLCLEWSNQATAALGLEMAYPFLDRDLLSFLVSTPGEVQSRNGVPKALLRSAVRGTVPDAIVDRKWKADFSNLVNQAMLHDYPEVVRLLGPECASVAQGYVTPHGLEREVKRARRMLDGSTCEGSWALKDLVGLELWLQQFIGSEQNGA